jgi:DNA-binding GntR family transcriptional regulator
MVYHHINLHALSPCRATRQWRSFVVSKVKGTLVAESPLNLQRLDVADFDPGRHFLKDQVATFLRDKIISGKIPPGTKVAERDVAEILNVSRAPARDALMDLEREGLIVSKADARYVIELTERDIQELHQVRLSLESLAVDLAIQNNDEANSEAQMAALKQMEDAVISGDRGAFAQADLDGHLLIWEQADNLHLEKMLRTMIGPIFMFIANASEHYDWNVTLELHREIVTHINARNREEAALSIERHLQNSCERALGVFRSRHMDEAVNR